VQIGVSVVAVVVKREHHALTVVTLCHCEMDVKEEQRVAIKFCCKVNFSATKTVELVQKPYGDTALVEQQFLSGTNSFQRVQCQ
jgi:hypothetical protein